MSGFGFVVQAFICTLITRAGLAWMLRLWGWGSRFSLGFGDFKVVRLLFRLYMLREKD